MTDIHDIREPISIKLIDIRIVVIVCLFVTFVVCATFLFFFYKKVKRKRRIREQKINYQQEAIKRLNQLKKLLEKEQQIKFDEVYFQISSIVRWYIGGIRTLNALSKTRHEVYMQLTKSFDEILWQCYMVEFAGATATREDAQKTINLATERIRSCT